MVPHLLHGAGKNMSRKEGWRTPPLSVCIVSLFSWLVEEKRRQT